MQLIWTGPKSHGVEPYSVGAINVHHNSVIAGDPVSYWGYAGSSAGPVPTLTPPRESPSIIKLSKNGDYAALASEIINLMDLRRGRVIRQFTDHRSTISAVAPSNNEPYVWASTATDRVLRVFDSRAHPCNVMSKRLTNRHRCIAYSPDSSSIYCGGENITVVDLRAIEDVVTFRTGPSLVSDVNFHPTQCVVVTCADDRVVRVWDVDTRECIAQSIPLDGAVHRVVFDAVTGDTVLAATEKHLYVLDWEPFNVVGSIPWSAAEVQSASVGGFVVLTGSPEDEVALEQQRSGAATVIPSSALTTLDVVCIDGDYYHLGTSHSNGLLELRRAALESLLTASTKLHELSPDYSSSLRGITDVGESISTLVSPDDGPSSYFSTTSSVVSASSAASSAASMSAVCAKTASTGQLPMAPRSPVITSKILKRDAKAAISRAAGGRPTGNGSLLPPAGGHGPAGLPPSAPGVPRSRSQSNLVTALTPQQMKKEFTSHSTGNKKHIARPTTLNRTPGSMGSVSRTSSQPPKPTTIRDSPNHTPISSRPPMSAAFRTRSGNGGGLPRGGNPAKPSLEKLRQTQNSFLESLKKRGAAMTNIRGMASDSRFSISDILQEVMTKGEKRAVASAFHNLANKGLAIKTAATMAPNLKALICHRNATVVDQAIDVFARIIDDLGPSIRQCLDSNTSLIGVDVAGEERRAHCETCQSAFLDIYVNASIIMKRLSPEQTQRLQSIIDNMATNVIPNSIA